MKKIIFLFLSFSTILMSAASAQQGDSWKLYLNKQLLAQSSTEKPEPVITIDKANMKKKATITLQYTTEGAQENWKRTFYFNDKSEKTFKRSELKSQDGTITFALKDLLQAANSNTPLNLFTTSLPTDKSMAAVVRVRRFLVCKIQWK
jgi:hypothetical protein